MQRNIKKMKTKMKREDISLRKKDSLIKMSLILKSIYKFSVT